MFNLNYEKLIILTTFTWALTGCLASQPAPIEPTSSAQPKIAVAPIAPVIKGESLNMSLGPGDIFEVRVYQEKDLSNIYRVSHSGAINFPLIGNLTVNKLTSSALTQILTDRLKEYLKNPQVSVFVKEFQSKKIYVFGQVRKPGTFSYEEGMSIIQAITLAGGLQPLADPNKTYVNRVIKGLEQRIKVAVRDIGKGEAPNLYLKPGDIIYVPESMF